jgi:transposase-like protein
MTPLELSARLSPRWSGVLGVDGKAIWTSGKERVLIIAVDQGTRDVVHMLVSPVERPSEFHQVIHECVAVAGYPLRGLICDAIQGFTQLWRDYLAAVPLQLCRAHFDRRLDFYMPTGKMTPKTSTRIRARIELKERVRAVLYAPDEIQARRLFEALRGDQHRYVQAMTYRGNPIASLQRDWRHYMAHHRFDGVPADNNITENVIKQLGRKLAAMEGFQSLDSAERFLRLLIAGYRFRRFTDAGPTTNGRSPLQLAGIDLTETDWLTLVLGH